MSNKVTLSIGYLGRLRKLHPQARYWKSIYYMWMKGYPYPNWVVRKFRRWHKRDNKHTFALASVV